MQLVEDAVTLGAQKGGREQQLQQERESEQLQPPYTTAAAPTSLSRVASVDSAGQPRRPIATLSRRPAGGISHVPTVAQSVSTQPAPPASASSATSSLASSQSQQPFFNSDVGVDGLSSNLDQLALDTSPSPVRLTPLQSLSARPRGNPTSQSATRPVTDTATARRLVMGALGIRNERSEEEKEKERQARREHQRVRREQLAAGEGTSRGRTVALDRRSRQQGQRSGDVNPVRLLSITTLCFVSSSIARRPRLGRPLPVTGAAAAADTTVPTPQLAYNAGR